MAAVRIRGYYNRVVWMLVDQVLYGLADRLVAGVGIDYHALIKDLSGVGRGTIDTTSRTCFSACFGTRRTTGLLLSRCA